MSGSLFPFHRVQAHSGCQAPAPSWEQGGCSLPTQCSLFGPICSDSCEMQVACLLSKGTESLSSCPPCSTDAMNLALNPSVFTTVWNLTQGMRIHESCTFSYPKGVLQVNIVLSKIALVLQLGNVQSRVEHMSLPLPSKNLQ